MILNDNTVRKIQPTPQQAPQSQPQVTPKPQAKPQGKRLALNGVERVIIGIIGAVVVALMVLVVQTTASVAKNQRELQNIQAQTSKAKATNIDLKQEISELSSSDRLTTFAKKNGLSFNDANVRNITK